MSSDETNTLGAVTRGVCNAQVVMLGESATHGDGRTLAFKVALVEQLVDQCGFNTVLFEANQDEFIHLNQRIRAGETVSSDDLLTAVGGLWKFYREFRPLAPFLVTRAEAGKLFLGGLDDQLGQLGQDYANIQMVDELTSLLPQQQQSSCKYAVHKRIYSDYQETAPYSKEDQSQIDTCIAAMRTGVAVNHNATAEAKRDQLEMISATQRWIERDFSPDNMSMVNRDRSMFQTFQWWEGQFPKRSKVIVWAATVHIAKKGDPAWGDRTGTNFGRFVHRAFGTHARSIGFSAVSGSFRQGKGVFPAMPVSPTDSVEAQALKNSDTSYFDGAQLAALGSRPGAFFYHSYQTLPWFRFLDGAVVFRVERPPTDIR